MKDSQLDLVVAGTADAVLMVESEAKELSEETMLKAVMAGHRGFQPVIEAIIRLAEKAAKEPRDFDARRQVGRREGRAGRRRGRPARRLRDHRQAGALQGRRRRQGQGVWPRSLRPRAKPKFTKEEVAEAFHDAAGQGRALEHPRHRHPHRRPRPEDGAPDRLGQVGVLPRTHGSALFTRGETQALVVATLGTGEDEQFIDSLEGTYKERFLLHYNFPPYSVGETGRMGSPGRREIGHGKLAWRAIRPMLPTRGRVPLHDPRRLGDHRVRTARPRWRRSAAPRWR